MNTNEPATCIPQWNVRIGDTILLRPSKRHKVVELTVMDINVNKNGIVFGTTARDAKGRTYENLPVFDEGRIAVLPPPAEIPKGALEYLHTIPDWLMRARVARVCRNCSQPTYTIVDTKTLDRLEYVETSREVASVYFAGDGWYAGKPQLADSSDSIALGRLQHLDTPDIFEPH